MPTSSPLATLVAILTSVYRQAQQHHLLFSKNEAATRAALIDPVLRALGWETTNVMMVEPEYTVQNKQSLDYVLKTPTGAILAVIEAKKLGEVLDKLGHVGALIGYAFSLKPKFFFITDGLHWHCYSPMHNHYEPVLTFQLDEATLLPTALQLLSILDAAHAGYGLPNELVTATSVSKFINSPSTDNTTKKLTKKKVTKQSSAVSDSILFTELSLINLAILKDGQKPTKLRLPDGEIKTIHTWKDILLEITQLVLLYNKKLSLPLPDKAKKKRNLISNTKPLIGSSTATTYQGKQVFIYTNYSASSCISNALYAEALLPVENRKTNAAIAF